MMRAVSVAKAAAYCVMGRLAIARHITVGCDLMSIEELQSAVARLPAEELDRFSQWVSDDDGGGPTTVSVANRGCLTTHRKLTAPLFHFPSRLTPAAQTRRN
jgi:hypothetical protein